MELRVEFSNFRCLRQTALRLSPLTVLVGPNASGKSAALLGLDPELALVKRDVWQLQPLDASIERRSSGNMIFKSLWNHSRGAAKRWMSDGAKYYSYQRLHLDLNSIRQANQVQEATRLTEAGGNLANVFATLPRTVQAGLASQFSSLVPVFSDIDARPAPGNPGNHRLVFQDRWEQKTWYEPQEISDGSLLVLALLLLQHQSPPIDLLAIEELERGLHPYLLGEIIEILRKMSTGEVGKQPTGIVLVTHSPGLLEFAKPEEVRFFNRDATDGSVRIEEAPTDEEGWQKAFDEYSRSLGSLWLSGGLGGVPGG